MAAFYGAIADLDLDDRDTFENAFLARRETIEPILRSIPECGIETIVCLDAPNVVQNRLEDGNEEGGTIPIS